MLFYIDFKAGKPVYLQLVDQVKAAAASGALKPGEALPSIRPLAEQLRLNRNTVAKAYAELESQGVAENQPGRGCYLRPNHSPYSPEVRDRLLTADIDTAVVQAHHLQVEQKEFFGLVQRRWNHFEQERNQAQSK